MSTQRIKGQEVSILVVTNGTLEDTITDIQSFEFEPEFEIISKGYLGEKTNRKDEIFNGCKGSMEIHLHTKDWFALLKKIKDRAQRIAPDTVINITATLNFPDGDTPSVTIPDVKFGANPHSVPSRPEYVKVKVDFEAEDFDIDGV